jgi:hypothetical protein
MLDRPNMRDEYPALFEELSPNRIENQWFGQSRDVYDGQSLDSGLGD